MNSKQFFFCYDSRLANHLKFNKGVDFVTNARHKDTGNEFWMFPKSVLLNNYIKEWRDQMQKWEPHKH